jgi:hypothetical protein
MNCQLTFIQAAARADDPARQLPAREPSGQRQSPGPWSRHETRPLRRQLKSPTLPVVRGGSA